MKKIPVSMVVVLILVALPMFVKFTFVSPVPAQEASNEVANEQSDDLTKAIRLHNAGKQGDQEAMKEANNLLKMIVKNAPKNGLANAYFGSTYAIMGRDAKSLVNKIRYVNRGLRYLDQSLYLAPEHFVVRFIRANVNSSLPNMFNRVDKATEDMIALDQIYQLNLSRSRAAMMIDIYKDLVERSPETGPWNERLKQARIASGE